MLCCHEGADPALRRNGWMDVDPISIWIRIWNVKEQNGAPHRYVRDQVK